MWQKQFVTLQKYLLHISEAFDLKIQINDVAGFIYKNTEAFTTFYIHNSPFCMYVKSNQELWDTCLRSQQHLVKKCQSTPDIFFGICHAGVEEYVVPVHHNETLIAIISVGSYRLNEKRGQSRILSLIKRYGLVEEKLVANYKTLSSSVPPKLDIEALLCIAADYLATIYATMLESDTKLINRGNYISTGAYILQHIVDFIRRNSSDNLDVSTIANFCHCSESYINHLFKKEMGVNIRSYINKQRVEEAKVLLADTNRSMKDIAFSVGFGDTNYFSKVFTDLCGLPPTKYRKEMRAKN